jgi:hypothetical protein
MHLHTHTHTHTSTHTHTHTHTQTQAQTHTHQILIAEAILLEEERVVAHLAELPHALRQRFFLLFFNSPKYSSPPFFAERQR